MSYDEQRISDQIDGGLLKLESKPTPEQYGWHNQEGFDDEPSGWMFEGGEEKYYEALKKWQFMQDNRLGEEDMKNDITLPTEL